MEREALKPALEFIESINLGSRSASVEQQRKAITAIKAALAQPAQEPQALQGLSAYLRCEAGGVFAGSPNHDTLLQWAREVDAARAQPPQRTWVGLTDADIADCMEMSIQKTCRAIEAKLKEKNNG